MTEWKSFNPKVIAEFRANEGKVAMFGNLPLAILHTVGAKSGHVREVPLIVVLDGDEILIFGTNEGAAKDPVWCFNLRAHPRITVELGAERFGAYVEELSEAQADPKIQAQAAKTPQFVAYMESAAPRRIPVFSVRRV